MQPHITTDADGNVGCPEPEPHEPHTDAVWFDWQRVEVWTCHGVVA